MSYTTQVLSGNLQHVSAASMTALLVQDAVAQPSTTFSGSISTTTLTAADNTGFFPTDVIQLPGGAASALEWYMIRTCGVPLGTDNTTRVDTRANKAYASAISAASASPYCKVLCKYMPVRVMLTNLSTGERHMWARGMLENTAVKFATTGASSTLTNSGIVVTPNYVYFHPGMLSTSQSMLVEIEYPVA